MTDTTHGHRMPSTHWSTVRRAGAGDAEARRAALTELLRRYLPPLRFFLVAVRRVPSDLAEDLLQGFIADKVLAQDLFARADARRGRFRSFLLTSLERYCVSEHRRESAGKRGGGRNVGLDAAEDAADPAPAPPAAFDAAWARTLIGDVVADMRHACAERPDLWGVFAARLLPEMRGEPAAGYDELVGRYGLRDPGHASNLLTQAKRLYARLLRQRVGEYEEGAAAIEEEIMALRAALAAAPLPPPHAGEAT